MLMTALLIILFYTLTNWTTNYIVRDVIFKEETEVE